MSMHSFAQIQISFFLKTLKSDIILENSEYVLPEL